MKSNYEIVDLIWTRLNASDELKGMISGGIFKHKRPDGSTAQDIAIVPLVSGNEQLQTSFVNVNFHCQNLEVTIGGQPAVYQPDHVKLKEVTEFLIPLLDDYWTDDYHFEVQRQTDFEEPDIKETFSNIRVIVYSINV
ncbi:hypothetical protein [Flavihumibacter petaseus]|uniref:Uncharacterized protein n=1 Tax=Flavihumibacter petaseus NBRC 106054 TaxID=1220578 RepID=A0A0E9N358_9BACT|nr:hypothetical protein [Flavihumibacter petaseus]GAO43795.1 hypothetical protein FPE01S_02_09010 [Flavihumibacter petaseus NBRC 106054]